MPPQRPTPSVRVVVLNWNAAWLTARCLRSVAKTDYPAWALDVVVVDNASIDGSGARLRHDFPDLRHVNNPTNLGFAEGTNRALRDLDGIDYVALVNNDSVVDPGWLRYLVDALEEDPGCGAAAPKMLLEMPYTTIRVHGSGTLGSIRVDGLDLTRRCIFEHTNERLDFSRPLAITRTVNGSADIHIPVPAVALSDEAGPLVQIDWQPAAGEQLTAELAQAGESGAVQRFDERGAVLQPAAVVRRINNLGIELAAWTEARDRWFGAVDRPNLPSHDVWGFSGGGVLLRAEMLRQIGVFDPTWFAYYEDVDLSWRARRHGWRVTCVPASVLHHLHGGSAGPEAAGFFFLNYRNWLATVARNGTWRDCASAARTLRSLSWPTVRINVIGRLRRGQPAKVELPMAWLRVLAGTSARLPRLLGSRRGGPIGVAVTDRVRSRLQPAPIPRAPSTRLGGPTLCYVDVTVTVRSGWRAGIQRVVCGLIESFPETNPDLDLVPIVWSSVHQQFRRLDSDEYERLLAPTGDEQPRQPPPAPSDARRFAAAVMHRSRLAPLVYRVRHQRELRRVPPVHRTLLLDRWEPDSVFLDLDASWNPTTSDRQDLLLELQRSGVSTMALVYDLVPITNPEWFIPELVEVFTEHLIAHLRAGSDFLCISEDSRSELLRFAAELDLQPETAVIPLGSFVVSAATRHTSPEPNADQTFLLTVGTIEPRKGHETLLHAFRDLRAQHPQVRLEVVGRPGWKNQQVEQQLRVEPGVTWRSDVTDAELDQLYRNALVCVVPSITEGYGLPVVEALERGTPVISSTGGALPEVGGELVEYFDVSSTSQLTALMRRHLEDPAHHESCRLAASSFTPRAWSDAAAAAGHHVRTLAHLARTTRRAAAIGAATSHSRGATAHALASD